MKSLEDPQAIAEILTRLAQLKPDSPRKWGTMTPHQMLCHLADAKRMVTGEKQAEGSGTFIGRTIMKYVALHVDLEWPHGVKSAKGGNFSRFKARSKERASR